MRQEALKTRRLEEKQERKEKKKQLEEKWEMLRWVTTYLEKNQARWEREKEERRMEQKETLAAWEKRGRLDKLSILKEKLTITNLTILCYRIAHLDPTNRENQPWPPSTTPRQTTSTTRASSTSRNMP